MDTLDNTEWDVLVIGTGLKQSLLALALSRSGKKILHIDENAYYGGAEAAFSLQEAEEWAKKVNEDSVAAFTTVSISKPDLSESETSQVSLSASRSYTLALSPQLIYTRSALLQSLISSKVYRQLDFVAVGSWWVYSAGSTGLDNGGVSSSDSSATLQGTLLKVPNGREDVFQDQGLDFKAKRALMKFLRFIGEYEEQGELWEDYKARSFPSFLSEQFKVPVSLHAPLLALTLSPAPPEQTTTEYALPRIARHLRSIGSIGAGFGSVITRFGGMSEIAQVACRACAVGGGVYVLGKGASTIERPEVAQVGTSGIKLCLEDSETVTTQWLIGDDTAHDTPEPLYCRSITIVSSTLAHLFSPIAEGAPPPACAVVIFPSGSLSLDGSRAQGSESPPVYILVHASDTGECPRGQSILYASTSLSGETGFQLLNKAVQALLSSIDVTPLPAILWSMQYGQRPGSSNALPEGADERLLGFSPSSLDLTVDDSILDQVKEVWQKIVGDNGGEFLTFEDREANLDDDE
ncbi:rab geranylgeranyl transferase escort protein-like protein [Lojkania enalia]|uniref:Rab proteins geranylgeranyltransferase n=1 Tax=Lojkania enalia TaxID=147567 RepID=A0A9P4K833_9PLEO|nr:rab geranylgeranyl transferase escort protein-like protein [Didymosphaeria enalia]